MGALLQCRIAQGTHCVFFSEPFRAFPPLTDVILSIFDSARFVISAAKLQGLPPEGLPEIAFAGRSNAGKSTTINVLTRKTRLAFASKTPGRTQLVNFFALSRKVGPSDREDIAHLVDLPGYGFAKANESIRQTWSSLVGGYIAQRTSLTGLVVVMDARRPFMPTDEWLIEFMKERPNVKMHWLLNKADQLRNMERRRVLDIACRRAEEIGPRVSVQLFSAMKREGVTELAATLERWLGLTTLDAPTLTSPTKD